MLRPLDAISDANYNFEQVKTSVWADFDDSAKDARGSRNPRKGSHEVPTPSAHTGKTRRPRVAAARINVRKHNSASRGPRCSVNDDRTALRERVREANDIVDVVGTYLTLRQAGPIYKALCPFHDDKNPSLTIDPRKQSYKCWACGEWGDVFTFVQKMDHVEFFDALKTLAQRAGISLEKFEKKPQGPSKAGMLDVMKWAAERYQHCLLESPQAEQARKYLGERKLAGETVRKFGLGYAPDAWEWLVGEAVNAQISAELLEQVGLIAKRNEQKGYYDRFRDRVMFPIRDLPGRIVGFGGRILPSSPVSADRPPPKYYNSAETAIFSKSENLYGIEAAKAVAPKCGYLAVVEGYTDVLMAHQYGLGQVVATMGTALNERHIKQLKRVAPRVVLVFDADAGGDAGVDRALTFFVKDEIDLRIATLPKGLDPCDLLVAQGSEPFRTALENAVDVFELKLWRMAEKYAGQGVEGQAKAADEMLGILAQAPNQHSVKMGLMVNRIAQRLLIKEDKVWDRLKELRTKRNGAGSVSDRIAPRETAPSLPEEAAPQAPKAGKALPHERELLELLLAEPRLIATAIVEVQPDEMEHPGLRKVIEAMYRLHAHGQPADLDHLQECLDNALWQSMRDLQLQGLDYPDRPGVFQRVLERFRVRRRARRKQALLNELKDATDEATKMNLLRQLRDYT